MVSTSGIRRSNAVRKNGPGAAGIVVKSSDHRIYVDRGNTFPETLALTGAKILTAAQVLTSRMDGTTFFLDLAGGFNVTLPAAALGLKFTFIVKTAPTTAYTITAAVADTIIGQANSSTGGDADSELTAGADVVNFVASVAVAGDRAEFVSDGTNWYVQAFSDADAGVTFTG